MFDRSALSACLALALAIPGLLPAQQVLPDPLPLLRSGPLLGAATPETTTVWVQTRQPCRVQVRYWPEGQPDAARLTPEVQTAPESDLIARLAVTGLRFGTRYDYELFLDGQRVPLPYPLRLRSKPVWRHRTDPPDVRIAFGSCAYINDLPYDRPNQTYGGDYEIFRSIAAAQPDLMLWLGDNAYYREGDWGSEAGMRRRMSHDRALPEMQPLFAAAQSYAIWDDHDFGSNDADRTFPGRETALRVFRDYWDNPSYGTAETPGVFTRFTWSDAEFFLLDGRYHRSPDTLPDGDPGKQMFGAAQLRWLEEALASSQATFKIVASGNQFWSPLTYFEAFGNFPAEQKQLLDFLRRTKIPGVVFLSGDRHAAELIRRQEKGLYTLYDFTSSPLTSGMFQDDEHREQTNPARVPGTWVMTTRNFGMLEITGKPGARVLTFRALDVQGKELWRHAIPEGELR